MVGCHQSVPRRFENIRRRAPPHRFGGSDRKVYSSAIRCRWGTPSRVIGGVQRSMGRWPRRRRGRGHDLGHHGDRPVGPVVSEEGDFVPDRGLHQKQRGNGDGQLTNGPYGLPIWSIGQWGPQTLAESPGNRIQLAELAGLFSFEKSVPPNPVAGVVFLLRVIGYDNLDDDKI